MKTIASWAQAHPYISRFLITIAHLFLLIIACFWGGLAYQSGLYFPVYLIVLLSSIFVLGILIYPSRGKEFGRLKNTFSNRKTCDFTLVFSGILLMTVLSNRLMHEAIQVEQIVRPSVEKPTFKQQQKQQRKWIRQQIKTMLLPIIKKEHRQKKSGEAGRAIAVVFSVLVALFLSLLVIGFACNLSCSGAGAAAAVVLILSEALIIFLLVLVINKIRKNEPPKYLEDIEIDEKDPDKDLYFQ